MRDITHELRAKDDVRPPSGNTGAQITRAVKQRPPEGVGVSVGWLSATFKGPRFVALDDFTDWAARFFGELEYLPGAKWRLYTHVLQGEHGVRVGVRACDGGLLEIHMDIPATVLEGLRPGQLVALLRFVNEHAKNVTRLDVTLDDWCKLITPFALLQLTSQADDPYTLVRDHLVTRAETADYRRSQGPKGGDSWYLGAPMGDARLRVYDKARESQGEYDCIRWELQLRDKRAGQALSALVRCVDGAPPRPRGAGAAALADVMGGWAASELVRFVDFRDRNDDANISRCSRLGWWAALVLNAASARPERVEPPLTVQKMHDYASTALPSWLATLADSASHVLGLDPLEYLSDIYRLGQQKRSPRHRLALRAAGVS